MSAAAGAATEEVYQVLIEDTGETYPCGKDRDLLRSMERLGRRGIPAGCRGGGCGVCKVRILSGSVTSKKMSRAHVTEQEEKEGFVLACRSFPSSDVRLAVVGKMRKTVCRIVPAGGFPGVAGGRDSGREGSAEREE